MDSQISLPYSTMPSFIKKILIITPFFRPNVGGAETYINELCNYLRTHNYYIYVLTYQPLTNSKTKGKKYERIKNMEVRRYWWIGYNLFHRLEKYPFLIFLYITPYLLLRCSLWMLKNYKNVDLIDAQGLNSAFIAKILKRLFKKKVVVSIMSIYDFIPGSRLARRVARLLNCADKIIAESEQSKKELVSIEVPPHKITPYVEWVDLKKFRPRDKETWKEKLKLPRTFTVLFVARAIRIKGADLLLEVAKRMRNEKIIFVFISRDGPMVKILKRAQMRMKNIIFIEGVKYDLLPYYYAAADIFVIPSKYSENAARTIVEAIASGTPVIGSNIGAIPSLINGTVGILVKPEIQELEEAIRKLWNNKRILKKLTANCRLYALQRFSQKNAEVILNCYTV